VDQITTIGSEGQALVSGVSLVQYGVHSHVPRCNVLSFVFCLLQTKLEYENLNRNTEFLSGKGFFVFYALMLIGARTVIYFFTSMISPKWGQFPTTTTHIIHSFLTLYSMHWVKGAPFWAAEDQGRFAHLTFWEQIDHGRQNTATKKILTVIPLVLFLLASLETDWDKGMLFLNAISTVVAVLGKLPFMHRTRIFGINKD